MARTCVSCGAELAINITACDECGHMLVQDGGNTRIIGFVAPLKKTVSPEKADDICS